PVQPPETHPLLVERNGEEETEEERREDRDGGEDDRPDQHAQERAANERIVDQTVEVREADLRPPTGLDLLPARGRERALAVVAKHDAVLEPRERVGARVVAKRLLEDDGGIEALRANRALADRHRVVRKRLVEREQLVALDQGVAVR